MEPEGIPRLRPVSLGAHFEVDALVANILSIPPVHDETEALAVFCGMGETWRLDHVLSVWDRNRRKQPCIVAGVNPREKSYRPLSEHLREHDVLGDDNLTLREPFGNARDQAVWLAEVARKRALSSIALFVPAYHLPRAYLTVLRAFKDLGLWKHVLLIPVPTCVPPNRIVPEVGQSAQTLVAGEFERIVKYQEAGHVATLVELNDYLAWAWEQPILARRVF